MGSIDEHLQADPRDGPGRLRGDPRAHLCRARARPRRVLRHIRRGFLARGAALAIALLPAVVPTTALERVLVLAPREPLRGATRSHRAPPRAVPREVSARSAPPADRMALGALPLVQLSHPRRRPRELDGARAIMRERSGLRTPLARRPDGPVRLTPGRRSFRGARRTYAPGGEADKIADDAARTRSDGAGAIGTPRFRAIVSSLPNDWRVTREGRGDHRPIRESVSNVERQLN
jgi:hypothetical protein